MGATPMLPSMKYKEEINKVNKILKDYFARHKRIYRCLELLIGLSLIIVSIYVIAWIVKLIVGLFI